MKTTLTALAVVAVILGAGCGGEAEQYPDVEPYDADVPFYYSFRLPDDYDPDDEYQLVFALHGHHRSERQVLDWWDDGLLYRPDFILVAIRAPFHGSTGYSWIPREPRSDEENPNRRRVAAVRTAEQLILDVFDEIAASYLIDMEDINLLGVGQGAGIAWYTALRNPGLFSGVIALSERGLPSYVPRPTEGNAGHLDVFIGIGQAEGPAPVKAARRTGEVFSRVGAEVEFGFHDAGPVVTAAQLRAMQNFYELGAESAPVDDVVYDEDGFATAHSYDYEPAEGSHDSDPDHDEEYRESVPQEETPAEHDEP
jgi:predicted esterase